MGKRLKTEIKAKKKSWNLGGIEKMGDDVEMLSSSRTEIIGNQKISIDGCLGVYEYRDTYLKLRLQKGSLSLCGSEFCIVYFENKSITVKGKIASIEFV